MRLGSYELLPIETGRFALDGGAMFGVVPRALWERKIAPDPRNRIHLALRALLVREIDDEGGYTGMNILVDTGAGQKWDEKHEDIYGIDMSLLTVERSLAQAGLRQEDISDVLLTHLHFDHAGGSTRRNAEGDVVPTFPSARYWVQAQNLEWAMKPSEKDRASYLKEDFLPLLEAGRLETLDAGGEWRPGIELFVFQGHTFGMQLPMIHAGGAALIYCADLIPTAAHIPIPWIMAYDNQPLVTMEEKRRILTRASEEGWWLFFEHDPVGPAARVRRDEEGFQAGERSDLLS